MSRRTLLALFALTAALAGCGVDPLVGTWRNTVPVGAQSIVSDMTFRANHTLDRSTTFAYPGDAPQYPGCTEVQRSPGAGWSTSASGSGTMTLTVTPPSPIVNTLERTGCTHPADNLVETPQNGSAMGMTASGTFTYTIAGDTLTWTPASTGMPADPTTFTRVMSL